jgi:hypothetical protein
MKVSRKIETKASSSVSFGVFRLIFFSCSSRPLSRHIGSKTALSVCEVVVVVVAVVEVEERRF